MRSRVSGKKGRTIGTEGVSQLPAGRQGTADGASRRHSLDETGQRRYGDPSSQRTCAQEASFKKSTRLEVTTNRSRMKREVRGGGWRVGGGSPSP